MTTSSSVHGSENGNIADLLCTLVREQAAPLHKELLNPLIEIH